LSWASRWLRGASTKVAAGHDLVPCSFAAFPLGLVLTNHYPVRKETIVPKIIVTGGSGKAGRACIQDLLAHGYEVYNIDSVIPARELCPGMQADLSDFGQTLDALHSRDAMPHGVDGVVHLAAIPAPRRYPNPELFRNNTLSIYNVFEAARRMASKTWCGPQAKPCWAFPFDAPPPYVPLDENTRAGPKAPIP